MATLKDYHLHRTVIFLVLVTTPLLYSGIISFLLKQQFDNETNKLVFLLYNTPFWFLLMFIAGVELYRRAITRQFTAIAPAYMLMMGSALVGFTGIVICPVGPELFSSGGLILISTNLVLGYFSGLSIDWSFQKICNSKPISSIK